MLTMKCQVLVDWLTFSVKETDPAAVIKNYLGLDPALFQDAGYGLLGYNRVLRFSDICVCRGKTTFSVTWAYVCPCPAMAAGLLRPCQS